MTHRTLHRPVHFGACADPPTASPWATLPEVQHVGVHGRPFAWPGAYHVTKKIHHLRKKKRMEMKWPLVVGYTLVEQGYEDTPW